jgi:hypothetical protein
MTAQSTGSVSRARFADLSASTGISDPSLSTDRAANFRKKRCVLLAGVKAGVRAERRFFAFAGGCAELLLLGAARLAYAQGYFFIGIRTTLARTESLLRCVATDGVGMS